MCLDKAKLKIFCESWWRRQELLEKKYYGIIKSKRNGETTEKQCLEISKIMALMYFLGSILHSRCSCGYLFSQLAVKHVFSVWLSLPLPDLSLPSKVLAVFSLPLILFSWQFLLPATKASLGHHHLDFRVNMFTAPHWIPLLCTWDTVSNQFTNP